MRIVLIACIVWGGNSFGQSIWRQHPGTSVAGQSIWHHSKSSAPPTLTPVQVRAGGGIRRSDVVILNFGPSCDGGDTVDASYAREEAQSYYQPGYQWGAGLRQNNLAWSDFLPYLEQYLLIATPSAQGAFRRGFVEGFGGNGEATYDYAFRQASRPG